MDEAMDIEEFNNEVEEEIKLNINGLPFAEVYSSWDNLISPTEDSRLARLLKGVVFILGMNSREISASNQKVILEICECIQKVLLCIPTGQMPSDVDRAYYKLLDALAESRFPVTTIVNHVMVVGLRQSGTICEYYNDIMCPNDTTKLNYFLKHAHDPHNGFSLKGFRLSDFLLADYFRQDCPRALLDILRYGCSDLLKKKCFDMKRHNWRQVGCTNISEYKLLDTLQFFLSLVSYMGPTTNEEFQAKVDCLKVIFRSIYTFSFEQLYALSDFAEYTEGLEEFKSYGLKFLNKTDRFPELDERIGNTAPSLKHMCRFEIRKALYRNWALPDGIRTLGLPFVLEEYLDLKTD